MTATIVKKEKIANFVLAANDLLKTASKVLENVKKVCCFASVLAVFNSVFFIGVPLNTLWGGSLAVLGIIGMLCGIIACPMKLLKTSFELCFSAFLMGLAFVGIGCLIGLMIGITVSFLMIFIVPAFVTIPHYINKLK